jgi:hypothetical protein
MQDELLTLSGFVTNQWISNKSQTVSGSFNQNPLRMGSHGQLTIVTGTITTFWLRVTVLVCFLAC